MPTDPTIDPSETTVTEVTPPSPETTQPSPETTESVEELKEKLAVAETEAARWKGRVEKSNEKKKKVESATPADLEELEWKLENKGRIELVKEEYEKIVAEGYHGEPVSKKIALELAEKQAKVDTSTNTRRDRQNDMTTPSVTNRNVNSQGYESAEDEALGLTTEKKRKMEARHPHLKM